jgi:F-box protein 18 (helicase)
MEYDSIQLANDFMTEEKLEKIKDNTKAKEAYGQKLNEEINLLYVAVTRTKNTVYIPEALLPKGFEPSDQIKVIELKPVKAETENEMVKPVSYQMKDSKRKAESVEKAYVVTEIRNKHKAAYQKWSPELDKDLMALYEKGTELTELIKYFGRTSGAITSRIRKLEGIEMVSD